MIGMALVLLGLLGGILRAEAALSADDLSAGVPAQADTQAGALWAALRMENDMAVMFKKNWSIDAEAQWLDAVAAVEKVLS